VRRRLIAHKQRDNHGALPIAVTGRIINLLDRKCVDTILATILEAEQHFGCKVGLAIFDTYSKGIAAGGGDEDKAKDQNIVQANLRQIFDRGHHIHIAGVGHTGKDESKGERGSNARLADVDLQVQISGDAIKTATVTKANDQPYDTHPPFGRFGCGAVERNCPAFQGRQRKSRRFGLERRQTAGGLRRMARREGRPRRAFDGSGPSVTCNIGRKGGLSPHRYASREVLLGPVDET
jgi:hypothetical protein